MVQKYGERNKMVAMKTHQIDGHDDESEYDKDDDQDPPNRWPLTQSLEESTHLMSFQSWI
ncbi:hypothetical protein DFA_00288 [Cavenderia fasciculata]|uniref:Uncharacterized protein n=1 Tax=Cavenderia fasciculata TaxID=261658 RepID=F4PY50_CACFS|nr:uncharacterized protein DFA_00288 [Cavenderia fasciculata]EGG19710.1 hypothetical protein DFA_00288 [Cavenderia fasciculata]|eukprot:XP_004358004.1 hypothetical protein DFA_00288 [Cavenderia fasciculata]